MSQNLIILFAVAGAVGLLAVIQFLLATRHDHAVSLAGPLEEESAVNARVNERRELLVELDEELAKRREVLGNLAKVSADVEEMQRRRDELLAEWHQLDERRSEVREVRKELDEALSEKLAVAGDLAAAKSELETISDRLGRAEELMSRVEAMESELSDLKARRDALRDEVQKLEEAEARIERLSEREASLQADIIRLEDVTNAKEERLNTARAEVEEMNRHLVELQKDRATLGAELANARTESLQLSEKAQSMEARRAVLAREIEQLEIKAQTGSAASTQGGRDPLEELKSAPVVLDVMNSWSPAERMNEADALKGVTRRFAALGLEYHPRTLFAFHTAMKANETSQMAVLAGISGTGKSQLPRQYALGMGIGFLQIPVQPRWDSPQDLMGFYNYIEGRFRPTDMARALYALDPLNNNNALDDRMLLILLDEMNLARVEYYFSDFLSRLEARPARTQIRDEGLRKDAELELEIPNLERTPRIFPGYNVLFAGTMNEDESTQSLSDKVVDRANLIRFAAPRKLVAANAVAEPEAPRILSRSRWDNWCDRNLPMRDRNLVEEEVERMSGLMKDFGRPFGHRLARAIASYVALYPDTEGVGDRVRTALADQVEMRLLPKLRGVEVDEARGEFTRLREFVEKLGDDTLSQAIKSSEEHAEATGQFVWLGVTR